jgi:hypothetical protein
MSRISGISRVSSQRFKLTRKSAAHLSRLHFFPRKDRDFFLMKVFYPGKVFVMLRRLWDYSECRQGMIQARKRAFGPCRNPDVKKAVNKQKYKSKSTKVVQVNNKLLCGTSLSCGFGLWG